ncbi:MAG: hypothetical protein N2504_03535 [candidate division WOR-3 bacterium]|nr:hypothetical protein [candidate division WOR-3 bacterium]MCX7947639.1 hypothetical protein [candidate division WOR-3 bacterium]MDW8150517.1 hypothetical protein [candidate division WOR-3 bacterium]
MVWLVGMLILEKVNNKIADGYHSLEIRGISKGNYVANAIMGNINYNTCEIPLLNFKFQVDGLIKECIYKPTKNLNEFKIVIYYKK